MKNKPVVLNTAFYPDQKGLNKFIFFGIVY